MEANRTRGRWTYAEFARLPSEGGTRHEIIAGELVVTPAPRTMHQRVITRLILLLGGFVEKHGLGEVLPGPIDVLLAEGDYLEPDVVFVRRERAGILSDRGVEAAPDLVIEVASPSTASRDRGIKLERYRLHGVPEYWVVDPDAPGVEVWDLAGGAAEPRVVEPGETLRWAPIGGAAVLEIPVEELLEGG